MLKKTMLLAMAVGALVAFAAPAVAQADRLAINGQSVEVGTEVEAIGFSMRYEQSWSGQIRECYEIVAKGEVVENTSTQSEIEGVETQFNSCNEKIAEPQIDNIIFAEGGGSFTMSYETPQVWWGCVFSGTLAFDSNYESNVLSLVAPSNVYRCNGSAVKWTGTLHLQKPDETPIEVIE